MLETLRNNKLLSALLLALAAALTTFAAQFWGDKSPAEVTTPASETPANTTPTASVTGLPTPDVSEGSTTDGTVAQESSTTATTETTETSVGESQQP